MKKIFMVLTFLIISNVTICQSNSSDPAYKNPVNKNYTGNVKETGVNTEKVISKKLQEVDKNVNSIRQPEGWDELLQQAEADEQNTIYKLSKTNTSKIKVDNKIDKSFWNISKSNLEFKNLLIMLICLFSFMFSIIFLKKQLKNKFILNKNEILVASIIIGVLIGLFLGYFFGEVQYITSKGYRLKEPNDYTNEVFKINYLLFFCGFIISAGLSYLFLSRKINQ